MGFDNIPAPALSAFGSIAMDGDEYVRCTRCSYGGCDVRVSLCGCTLHAVSLRAPSTDLPVESDVLLFPRATESGI
jgi:hypothetical protein